MKLLWSKCQSCLADEPIEVFTITFAMLQRPSLAIHSCWMDFSLNPRFWKARYKYVDTHTLTKEKRKYVHFFPPMKRHPQSSLSTSKEDEDLRKDWLYLVFLNATSGSGAPVKSSKNLKPHLICDGNLYLVAFQVKGHPTCRTILVLFLVRRKER